MILFSLLWFILLWIVLWIRECHAEVWQVERATHEVILRGYTRSVRTAVISAEVGGRLIRVHYEVGDTLTQRPFAELDPTLIDFDIEATRLALEQLRIRILQMDSRIAFLKKDAQRKETLFAKGRTTEVIRDAANQELEQAMLDRERLIVEKNTLHVTLKRQQEQIARHTIPGMEGWIVTDRKVEKGEVIQAGAPLAVIQDFREMVVPLALSNDELKAIGSAMDESPDQENETIPVSVNGTPARASLYYINPEFDEKSRKTAIKIRIHGFSGTHRGGLGCEIPLRVRSKGVKIPSKALQNRYENPKVFVKGSDTPVPVTVLDRAEPWVIIADDPRLPPGTLVTDQP